MRVSVIIPTFNMGHLIGEAVQSVRDQKSADLETIVVDDGSTDETKSKVEGRSPAPSAAIRYMRQDHRGVSAARNAGIAASTAEFIAFLDADDLWLPGKLERQLAVMNSNKDLALVYGNVFEAPVGAPKDEWRPWPRVPRPDRFVADVLLGASIVPAAVLIRRDAIGDGPLFDESLTYAEDQDAWLSIAVRRQVALVEEPLAVHRQHAGQVTGTLSNPSVDVLLDRYRCQMRFLDKSFSRPELKDVPASLRRRAYARMHHERGGLFFVRGHRAEAKRAFREAIRCQPLDVMHYIGLVRSLIGI